MRRKDQDQKGLPPGMAIREMGTAMETVIPETAMEMETEMETATTGANGRRARCSRPSANPTRGAFSIVAG
jgi:hypothetical protein